MMMTHSDPSRLDRQTTGDSMPGAGEPPFPVIVGVPRSGTTLLRMMLDASPDLAIPPETGFLAAVAGIVDGPEAREAAFDAIRFAETWPDFGLLEADLRSEVERLPPTARADVVRTFYRMYSARFGKVRTGDKTPGYGYHLTDIEQLLPEARFIHLIRDGRDVALSVRVLWFSPGETMAAIAADWRNRIEATRFQGRACAHYMEVRYEDLVERPEATLRRIGEFIEVPFDPVQLEYHRRTPERLSEHRDRYDRSGRLIVTHAQRLIQQHGVTQPLDLGRLGHWRTAMSTSERREFEDVAGDLLRELSYEVAD